MDNYENWKAQRAQYVTSPTGNLSLVGYQSVTNTPQPLSQVPITISRHDDEQGIRVNADQQDGVQVDGQVIDGEVFVGRLQEDGTPIISHDHYHLDVFSLDGSEYEVRIYDEHAEHLKKFDHIDYYDYDPKWVLNGQFSAYEGSEAVEWGFTRTSDSGHVKQVPGTITVEIDDQTYQLMAFVDGSQLVLVFADATTGKESYAPGRFLKMPLPNASQEVTLDFNYAFIPPCGFSYSYSCPIPPAQNKIDTPVRAGERAVVWKSDE